jgi:hypothetical protein
MTLNRLYKTTPDNTAVTQFKMGVGSATPAVTDTALQTPVGGFYGYVATYPQFDTVNQLIKTRGFIPSTDLNGNTLTETGEFNTDLTPVLFSRSVFTGITKTSAVEIAIIWQHKISS